MQKDRLLAGSDCGCQRVRSQYLQRVCLHAQIFEKQVAGMFEFDIKEILKGFSNQRARDDKCQIRPSLRYASKDMGQAAWPMF